VSSERLAAVAATRKSCALRSWLDNPSASFAGPSEVARGAGRSHRFGGGEIVGPRPLRAPGGVAARTAIVPGAVAATNTNVADATADKGGIGQDISDTMALVEADGLDVTGFALSKTNSADSSSVRVPQTSS
jgi:hypothetical protein